MLEGILEKLKGGEETLKFETLDQADKEFEEKRKEKLEEINKKDQEFLSQTKKVLEELDSLLEDIEGFNDPKDRAVVEDVVDNVVEKRRKLINSFKPKKDIKKLENQLEKFFDEYQEISQKEGAVLEEANLEQKLGNSLKELQELHKEIQNYLEKDYRTFERCEELKDNLEDLEGLEKDLSDLQKEKEELNTDLTNQIEDNKEKLEILENSDSQQDYQDLDEEIDEFKSELGRLEKDIGKNIGKMERGLKKLIHDKEISKTSREGSKILREIRDGEKDKILNRDAKKVEKAVEAVENSLANQLDNKTEEKLLEGIATFENFSETREKMKGKTDRLEELEEKAANHEFIERKKELKTKIGELKEEKEDIQTRKSDLKSELDNKKHEIESKKNQVKEILREEFGAVEIENEDL